jgi:hypothetical protein
MLCSTWGYFAARFGEAAIELMLSTGEVYSKVSRQALAVGAHACGGYEKARTGYVTR